MERPSLELLQPHRSHCLDSHPIKSVESKRGSISIDRPLPNTQLYILDANLQPVPVGALGQLYIGGAGLSRGYLNLPELTAQKFISNPFCQEIEARLYKAERSPPRC